MRIKNLTLKNIGPFREATVEFISNEDELENPPVICITGENGTGKSIVIDAIRALFKGQYNSGIERDITSANLFLIESDIQINNQNINFKSTQKRDDSNAIYTNQPFVNELFTSSIISAIKQDFIFDYWTSKLSSDAFEIDSIKAIKSKSYLSNALSGIHKNIDLIKVISFFDYLKDSNDEAEKMLGKSLYTLLKNIIDLSLRDGSFSHVSRINLKPVIKIGNREVTLDKLSSGNIYLIQRFLNLLSQVYSICVLNNLSISNYKHIKGVLLIDEAENHLHPKWQKVFLQNIQKLFPKLQIIVSTHSPFIVSSVKNCRVYVCESFTDYSEIKEETDFYSNKPIEEVLMSPLFNTSNFNIEISRLINLRKKALNDNDLTQKKKIESVLIKLNPEYFDYLNIQDVIKSIKK